MKDSLKDIEVQEGDRLVLTCAVKNPDQIDVRWLKRVTGPRRQQIRTRSAEKKGNIIKLGDDKYYEVRKKNTSNQVAPFSVFACFSFSDGWMVGRTDGHHV